MSAAGEVLRLACIDSDAPPLFQPISDDGVRIGFEPSVAALIGDRVGVQVEWIPLAWPDMIPAVQDGRADAVLCGQGMTAERLAEVDFTRPYAVFHEGVLVRRGSGISCAADLAGLRVAAIEHSTNMALASSFDGAVLVGFGAGGSDDVYADMLEALRSGQVDAVVDDDVVFVPLGESDPEFELAFVVQTANRWGIGVSKRRPDVLAALDAALGDAIACGEHRLAWEAWLPTLDYPFAAEVD